MAIHFYHRFLISKRFVIMPNQLPEPTLASGASPAGQEPRRR
jgi:hypothetical protein